MRTIYLSLAMTLLASIFILSITNAQENPKIITTVLPPPPCERTVEIIWYQKDSLCRDTLTLTTSPKQPSTTSSTKIKMNIQRKCSSSFQNSPIPQKARLTIKNIKHNRNEYSQELTPDNTSFYFEHAFKNRGTYQISLASDFPDSETHTVGLRCNVL